jgi:signal transduction histidine kinase
MELNLPDSAEFFMKVGLDYAKTYNIRHEKLSIYESYSKLRAKMNDFRGAYNYSLLYKELYDSIYNSEKEKLIAEIITKYDTEKKEKENEVLRQQNTIKHLQVEKAVANLRYVVAISTLIISFITIFLWWFVRSNRQRKKANALLEEKNQQINLQKEKLVETLHFLSLREQKLKEANATKDRFFSIIAHDLKNPFSGILGLSGVLAEDFDQFTLHEQKGYINAIYESSGNLYKLLENLLQWARSQLNQIHPKPETIILGEIFHRCVKVHQNMANNKKILINYEQHCELKALADKGMTETVIRNLLSNAIKFTPVNGTASIFASLSDGQVEVTVSDTGIGIDKKDINELFRIDKRIKKNGTANEQGTGLGLIICKEFIEKNGGTIRIESLAGKGSSFIFTLPAA